MTENISCFAKSVAAVLLTMLMGVTLYAQNGRMLTGSVADSDGNPVIGAGVLVNGSTSGTVTDGEGRFYLNLSSSGDVVLRVDCLGYKSRTITVPEASSEVNIVIE